MIKEIEGYGGRYTVSDDGRIFSNGKEMKPYKINSGYLAVKLRNKGVVKNYLVHRLVASYFLEGEGVVDHIDGNKLNNRVQNLRFCTQKQNLEYYGQDYHSGTNHYKSVFTIEDVKRIRSMREKEGMRNKDIYKEFPNVSHTAIDQILNYRTYKEIPC